MSLCRKQQSLCGCPPNSNYTGFLFIYNNLICIKIDGKKKDK